MSGKAHSPVREWLMTVRAAMAVCTLVLMFPGLVARATTFTCQTPAKGGKFTISIKSLTDKCEGIVVQIPEGKTAAEKAQLIADRINNSCAGVFTATASGANVTVDNTAHENQRVFFKFGPDDTGEKDQIEKDLQPGFWSELFGGTAPLYTCHTPASGKTVTGESPGMIYIGTSACVAQVATFEGMSPYDILNNARNQLINNGVSGVVLAEVSPGVYGLSFQVKESDTLVQWGDNDSGVECVFEMFEPPVPVFHQLNFNLDGTLTQYSDWGAVDLAFVGFENIMYLNLAIDTAWVIENMPVVTTRGYGMMQTQRFWFDIGSAGDVVTGIHYGLTLTPTIQGKPLANTIDTVTQDNIVLFTGLFAPGTGGVFPAPARKQVGGQAVDNIPKTHQDFPNQESPHNFCVPAGVSNSLHWLNDKYNLGMKAEDISINRLGQSFGTTPGNGTLESNIYPAKKEHCKKKKLPVTTRKFSGNRFGDVMKEIKNGQDVEMTVRWKNQNGKGHCVAVTGMTDLGNGKYGLVITHDKEQGIPGGTVDENATYDKNKNEWGGALSNAMGGAGDIMFIVECPVTRSKQSVNYLPGGTSHRTIDDAVMSFDNGRFQVTNLVLSGYDNIIPPPGYQETLDYSWFSPVTFDYSCDSGHTFLPYSAMCNVVSRVSHMLDSAGKSFFNTGIISMQLQGGNLPPGFIMTESGAPQDSSTGIMTLAEVPGGYRIDSFFDIFFTISTDGGNTWYPDDNQTTVLFADGPAILPFLNLQNMFFEAPYSPCFDATETITTGGDAPFMVFWGSYVSLIAGQSIHMLEGTVVTNGGSLTARIAQDGVYCPEDSTIPYTSVAAITGDIRAHGPQGGDLYRVYPNPFSQSFIIELNLSGEDPAQSMAVFDIRGNRVAFTVNRQENGVSVDGSGWQPGVYFLQIVSGQQSRTIKLIRY